MFSANMNVLLDYLSLPFLLGFLPLAFLARISACLARCSLRFSSDCTSLLALLALTRGTVEKMVMKTAAQIVKDVRILNIEFSCFRVSWVCRRLYQRSWTIHSLKR